MPVPQNYSESRPPNGVQLALLVALGKFCLHLYCSTHYGYFLDEPYYIEAAKRLQRASVCRKILMEIMLEEGGKDGTQSDALHVQVAIKVFLVLLKAHMECDDLASLCDSINASYQ